MLKISQYRIQSLSLQAFHLGTILFSLVGIGFPALAWSQNPPQSAQGALSSPPLAEIGSFRQAVSAALKHNPLALSAEAELGASERDREAASWRFFPTFAAQRTPKQPQSNASTSPGASWVVSVEQPLWVGGRLSAGLDVADAKLQASRKSLEETRLRVAEAAANAFLAYSAAIEQLRIARRGVAELERLEGYVSRRETAGMASLADVNFAKSRLAQAQVRARDAANNLDRAREDLRSITLSSVGNSVRQAELPPFSIPSAAEADKISLERSAAVAQAKYLVDSVKAQSRVQSAALSPGVFFGAQTRYFEDRPVDQTSRSENVVGIYVRFSPDAGLASYSSVKASESRVVAAESERLGKEIQLRTSTQLSLSEFLTAQDLVKFLQPQVRILRESTESFLRQFEAGRRTWIDVLNVNGELIEAELSLSKSELRKSQGQVRLLANLGSLFEWLETVPE